MSNCEDWWLETFQPWKCIKEHNARFNSYPPLTAAILRLASGAGGSTNISGSGPSTRVQRQTDGSHLLSPDSVHGRFRGGPRKHPEDCGVRPEERKPRIRSYGGK